MTETVGVRRSLMFEFGAFAFSVAGSAVAWWVMSQFPDPWDRWFYVPLAFVLFGGPWSIRSLARPWWFRVDDRGVTVARFLGGRETLPFSSIESHLGNVVDVRRNRRFWVGEARFADAEKLHRAIRVRKSSYGR